MEAPMDNGEHNRGNKAVGFWEVPFTYSTGNLTHGCINEQLLIMLNVGLMVV